MANLSSHHPDPAAAFDPHAITIAKRQYFQADDKSLTDMFRRVANWVARPEAEAVRDEAAEQFYQLMVSKRFCPGGRVLAGAAVRQPVDLGLDPELHEGVLADRRLLGRVEFVPDGDGVVGRAAGA